MTEKREQKASKRRTQVKELPRQEQELSKDEQQKVKGGAGTAVSMDLYANKPKQ
ncbi:MAG TPA: hypothetical protein VGB73_19375 [Pyrinomonadaceae bacterium]|jgi:hypothetical protein